MRLRMPHLADWVVASVVLAAMLFFLWPVSPWAAALAPLSATAVLFIRQAPVTMALVLALLQVSNVPLGVSPENPAPLAPMLIAVYSLGRLSPMLRGVLAALAYLAAVVLVDFSVGTVGFVSVIFVGVFTFGVLVRRRTASAHAAQLVATKLAGANVERHTASLVADERARIGGQALAVIRGSVDAMRRTASDARTTLDPQLIATIADRGRLAVTELRWLLGLLRAEQPAPARPAPKHRSRVATDAVIAAALIVLTVVDGNLPEQPGLPPLGWALLLGVPLAIIVRRPFPVQACVAVSGLVVAIRLLDTPLFVGFGIGPIVTVALLAWSIAVSGGRAAWGALALLAAVTALPLLLTEPGNVPMVLAFFAVPACAGHEWSTRDRELRRNEERAAELQGEIDRRVEVALRTERLRIARELHDVTSHAVGVMVLQASAAAALRVNDPDAARTALRTVESVGSQALSELAMLFDLLEAGAIGAPGLAGAPKESLKELVERMRTAGLRIEVAGGSRAFTDVAPDDAATLYRVVQEALTNVARHAPSAPVHIEIAASDGEIVVRVSDDGTGARAGGQSAGPLGTGLGFGLAGLAERVRARNGEFAAGPLAGGGFEVRAALQSGSTVVGGSKEQG